MGVFQMFYKRYLYIIGLRQDRCHKREHEGKYTQSGQVENGCPIVTYLYILKDESSKNHDVDIKENS